MEAMSLYKHVANEDEVQRARRTGYSVDREFAYGLDLILDALGRSVPKA